MKIHSLCIPFIAALQVISSLPAAEESPPAVGQVSPVFALDELQSGKSISLEAELKEGPVVLVVLRGYPGYQCPICSRQVGGLIQSEAAIAQAGARVILVYPGARDQLATRAKEFFQKHQLPENFQVVTDPDYKFTNLYHLRWDAPRETAYPSTFVVGKDGKVVFAQVSRTHGNRAEPQAVLKALNEQ